MSRARLLPTIAVEQSTACYYSAVDFYDLLDG